MKKNSIPLSLRFDRCELRLAVRELLRDGEPQALAPKIFDLLAYMVQNQGRVVTKAELLDQLWHGSDVTENVLARSVMKVRQAIGDTADQPRLLRTVNRIGYRFEASLMSSLNSVRDNTDDLREGSGVAERASVRVALLPVENLSGDDNLAWIAWGLPTLVGQALQSDQRLLVVSQATLQGVLARHVQPITSARPRARFGEPPDVALLGVHSLVRSSVRRSADGLRMDYESLGERSFRGTLKGVEATLLGQALAEAIEAGLFPDARSPVRFESTDPLASQAYARAMALSNQEEWAQAARLLRVVLDIAPRDCHARLHYVRMLANVHDPEAIAVGESLVQEAAQGSDVRLLAAAHEGLGRALYNLEGEDSVAKARFHMDQALELARPFGGEDWVIRVHLGHAVAAHMQREQSLARSHYELAWEGNEQSGNQMRCAMILNNRALLEASDGNLLVAREMAQQSLQICERFGLRATAVDALSNLSLIDAGLGLLDSAVGHCEAALEAVSSLPPNEHDAVAWVLLVSAELSWLRRQPALLQKAFALPLLSSEGEPLRVAAAWSVATAYQVAAHDPEQARDLLLDAVVRARQHGYLENAHQFLRRAVELWLRLGRWHELPAWFDQIQTLPGLSDDLVLQATVLRARAACALAAGNAADADRLLHETVLLAPPSQVAGLARLDLAARQCHGGDVAGARRTLRDAGSWLRHHPAGRRVAAALLQAQATSGPQHDDGMPVSPAGLVTLE